MQRVVFDMFSVQLPRGWSDVTDQIDADGTPYTFARPDGGVGALQFSIALYQSGPIPNPTPETLREMVERFASEREFGEPSAIETELGPPALAAGSFAWGEDFVRVWQVSDGRNFAFVTYTCAEELKGPELADCERIVRSIVFAGR